MTFVGLTNVSPAAAVDLLREHRVNQYAGRRLVGDAWQDRTGLVFTTGSGEARRPRRRRRAHPAP
jgi:hypothetical protein